MFIEAHINSGSEPSPHLFNINNIAVVYPTNDKRAVIKLTNGDIKTVTESYDQIKQAISALMGRPVFLVKDIERSDYKAGDMFS